MRTNRQPPAMRKHFAFTVKLQKNCRFMTASFFYGAAIEYGSKAYIFTAPSGTGETTHILHRIIKVTQNGYIIRGDNAIEKDAVKPEDIIGVLYAFTRNGKRYTVKDRSNLVYSHITVFFHPLKITIQRIKGKIKSFFK